MSMYVLSYAGNEIKTNTCNAKDGGIGRNSIVKNSEKFLNKKQKKLSENSFPLSRNCKKVKIFQTLITSMFKFKSRQLCTA